MMNKTTQRAARSIFAILLAFMLAVGLSPIIALAAGEHSATPVIIPELQITIESSSHVDTSYHNGWTNTWHINSLHEQDLVMTITNIFDRVEDSDKSDDVHFFIAANGTLSFNIDVHVYTDIATTIAAGEILSLSDYAFVMVPINSMTLFSTHDIYGEDGAKFTEYITFQVVDNIDWLNEDGFYSESTIDRIIRAGFLLNESPPPATGGTTAPNLSTASTWAHEGINNAIAAGLVPQQLQNNYTNNITRAEFTALAVNLYETITGREIEGRITFADTTDVNVQKAAYIGVVSGTGGNNFSPNMQFNREQAAVIVSRLAYAIGQPLPQVAAAFADNAQISSWAIEQAGQAQAAGIMGGVGNNVFNPQGVFSREQSIIAILRLFEALS